MTYPSYNMFEGLSLRSSGRSLQMGTRVTPVNDGEAAELAAFAQKGQCCKLVESKPAVPQKGAAVASKPAEAGKEPAAPAASAVSPESDLLAVPGVGQKTLPKLLALDIKTEADLKNALKDTAKSNALEAAVPAATFATWKKKYAAPEAPKGEAPPKSSREKKK